MTATLLQPVASSSTALLALRSAWIGEDATDRNERLNELVRACQRGERQAFDHLVRFIEQPLLRFATGIIGDAVSAEDAFIEAMAKVLPKIGELEDPSVFMTYARRAVRHASVDLRRSRQHRDAKVALMGAQKIAARRSGAIDATDLLAAPGASPEVNAMRSERLAKVDGAVERLKEPRRTIVKQHYLDGMTYEQIADYHGCSQTSVKRHLSSARLTIAARVRQEGTRRDA